MTLIATLMTPIYTLQVSDRRFSNANGVYQDHNNKAVCVVAIDGWFTIAFTGLAHIGKDTIDKWITDAVCAVDPNRFYIDAIIRRLRGGLDHHWRADRSVKTRCLTLACNGFTKGKSFATIISNFEAVDRRASSVGAFSDSTLFGNPDQLLFRVFGSESVSTPRVAAFAQESINNGLFASQSSSELQGLEEAIVQFVREGGKQPKYGYTIGSDCLTAWCFPGKVPIVRCAAYQGPINGTNFAPCIITKDMAIQDTEWVEPGDEFCSKTFGGPTTCQFAFRTRRKGTGGSIVTFLDTPHGPGVQLAGCVTVLMPRTRTE